MLDNLKYAFKNPLKAGASSPVSHLFKTATEVRGLVVRGQDLKNSLVEHTHKQPSELRITRM